jgi:hypothetical protein
LARAARSGARVCRAVFVTYREEDGPPTDAERDSLWEMFQVPAFAMLLDGKGRVRAYECEAQSGLHISIRRAIASAGTVVCECGRPGPKLYLAASAVEAQTLAKLTTS